MMATGDAPAPTAPRRSPSVAPTPDPLDNATSGAATSPAPAAELTPAVPGTFEKIPNVLPAQQRVRELYLTKPVQFTVAGVIFANFVTSAVQYQLLPADGTDASNSFGVLEVLFDSIFGFELAVNMYAHFFTYFWRSYAPCDGE